MIIDRAWHNCCTSYSVLHKSLKRRQATGAHSGQSIACGSLSSNIQSSSSFKLLQTQSLRAPFRPVGTRRLVPHFIVTTELAIQTPRWWPLAKAAPPAVAIHCRLHHGPLGLARPPSQQPVGELDSPGPPRRLASYLLHHQLLSSCAVSERHAFSPTAAPAINTRGVHLGHARPSSGRATR